MPKILIVDDSEVDRRIVGGLLEKLPDFQLEFAKNGREAISCLRRGVPDLVVTDLQMPERDGLELVRAIRLHYSQVPVILMTAHGSDDLAVEALEEGAVGYVSKSQLGARLADTVLDVLAIARADRSYERLIGCLRRSTFLFTLDNDPGLIDPLVDLIQQMVAGVRLGDSSERFRIGAALKAALLNALYRGNLELRSSDVESTGDGALEGPAFELAETRRGQAPYAQRRIEVEASIDHRSATIRVRDDGPGFDVEAQLAHAPAESVDSGSGRGLVLMRTFARTVVFNDRGNEVTLVFHGD